MLQLKVDGVIQLDLDQQMQVQRQMKTTGLVKAQQDLLLLLLEMDKVLKKMI